MKKVSFYPVQVTLFFLIVLFCSTGFTSITSNCIIIDDYSGTSTYRPWYYSRIGTDRGKMGSGSYAVDIGGGYATVRVDSGWAGVWTQLMHTSSEGDVLMPKELFGPYVKNSFQAGICGVEIDILDGTGKIKIELKNQFHQTVASKEAELEGGPQTIAFAVNTTSPLKEINWLIDGPGEVAVDEIRFRTEIPAYDTLEAVFLFSYGHLSQCYDNATGLVRDRAHWPVNNSAAVQSIGMYALVTSVAYDMNYIEKNDAISIVSKTKDTLLSISRFKGLLPHYLKNGAIVDNTEWSSVDTVLAIISELMACQALGIDTSELENMIKAIDWNELSANFSKSVSMGYSYSKELIESSWDTFGSEAFIISTALSAATNGTKAVLDKHDSAPTWDGAGFNDELAALFFPMKGQDVWGNDWPDYRTEAFTKQYSFLFSNSTYETLGLFGLSAGEVPEKWVLEDESSHYSAWGVGGHNNTANDGTAIVGYPIITPHYAAMVAKEHPNEAISLFEYLINDLGLFSPLNNVESFGLSSIHWNSLKGSWNLSMQALGAARALSGESYLPYRALKANQFLRDAYLAIMNDSSLDSIIDTPPAPFIPPETKITCQTPNNGTKPNGGGDGCFITSILSNY